MNDGNVTNISLFGNKNLLVDESNTIKLNLFNIQFSLKYSYTYSILFDSSSKSFAISGIKKSPVLYIGFIVNGKNN